MSIANWILLNKNFDSLYGYHVTPQGPTQMNFIFRAVAWIFHAIGARTSLTIFMQFATEELKRLQENRETFHAEILEGSYEDLDHLLSIFQKLGALSQSTLVEEVYQDLCPVWYRKKFEAVSEDPMLLSERHVQDFLRNNLMKDKSFSEFDFEMTCQFFSTIDRLKWHLDDQMIAPDTFKEMFNFWYTSEPLYYDNLKLFAHPGSAGLILAGVGTSFQKMHLLHGKETELGETIYCTFDPNIYLTKKFDVICMSGRWTTKVGNRPVLYSFASLEWNILKDTLMLLPCQKVIIDERTSLQDLWELEKAGYFQ